MGHAYSARCGFDAARAGGGRFLLRIEDIDRTRCRPEHEAALLADLRFLGLYWDGPIRRQSEHFADYEVHLAKLQALDLLYPCFCTRAEIAEAASAPNAADADLAHLGPTYPGRCRQLSAAEAARRVEEGHSYALRLHVEKALALLTRMGQPTLTWFDRGAGWVTAQPLLLGDVVLARKQLRTSYHLSVTVDDHLQEVTLVTRGEDLFHATHIHRLLQALLELKTPEYAHHPLLKDVAGQRLAKRRGSTSISALRAAGQSAEQLWAQLSLPPI